MKPEKPEEISPGTGTEGQWTDLAFYLPGQFEGDGKMASEPENLREKVRGSLQKISDEGKDYFICIVYDSA